MDTGARPKVSLGMPVYNAELFLEEALRSIQDQTFKDFELVITDNASTDRTEEICRRYASEDARIKYYRNASNVGAISNFRNVFGLARGEYFKWWASDDLCHPDYLRRSVEILDDDPTIVLVFSILAGIDEKGNPAKVAGQVSDLDSPASVSSPDPVVRFRKLLRHIWWVDAAFYGLIRTDVLAQTAVHPPHANGDQILLTDLILKGRFFEIPEVMFFNRVHPTKTTFQQTSLRDRAEMIEGNALGRGISARWKMIRAYPQRIKFYVSHVRRADLSLRQKIACYYEIGRSLFWWLRFRLYKLLARRGDFKWLRPDYPP